MVIVVKHTLIAFVCHSKRHQTVPHKCYTIKPPITNFRTEKQEKQVDLGMESFNCNLKSNKSRFVSLFAWSPLNYV